MAKKKQDFTQLKRFNYIITEMNALYHRAALRLGLSDSAMSILYSLCDSGGGRPLSEICSFSGLSKQTVGTSLHKLEADGYVRVSGAGGRTKTVTLTERGEKLAEKTTMLVMKAENEIFDSWSREELEGYIQLTQRFTDSFAEKIEQLHQKEKE